QHAMREAGVRLQSGVRPIETAQNPEKLANALEQAAKPIVRRDQEGFAYVERGPAGELIDESIAPINLRQQAALEGHKRNVQTYREGLRRIEADRKAAQGNITATARARAEIDRLVRSLGLDPEAQKRLLTLHDSQFKNGKPLRASALPAPQLNQADEAISGIAQRQANDLANDMMAGREAEYAPRNRQDPNFVRSMLDPRESANADRIMSGRDLADPKTVGRLELGARTAAGVAALGGGGAALSSWEPETDRRTTAPVPLNALPSPIEPRGNDVIARAQMALTQSGFDPGAVDGIMGKNTAIAIAQAEASFGMPITGQWSEELETALLQRPPMLDDQAAREGAPIRAR
ncbi:MAG: peptidoglycan-binding domain-containing protein, partial [Pseudomonadota bacterium]